MANNLRDIRFIDLIPPNLKEDKDIQAIAEALDVELQAVNEAIKECLHLPRLEELPESVLDHLAWQWHVDFYEQDLSLEQKRILVKTAIAAHRRKGTPYAVELVVRAILADALVQEWFEYNGQSYYFRVVKIGGQMINADMYTRLKKAINTVKNTRSWLEGISLRREVSETICFSGVQSVHKKIDIYPVKFRMLYVSGMQYLCSAASIHKRIKLR